MNQLDLAECLNVGERTLRRWKNGEDVLTDAQELKRLAELLDVEPERLGVVSSVHLPLTFEQIDKVLAHVWVLVAKARNNARLILLGVRRPTVGADQQCTGRVRAGPHLLQESICQAALTRATDHPTQPHSPRDHACSPHPRHRASTRISSAWTSTRSKHPCSTTA